jgi:hypothetical protein
MRENVRDMPMGQVTVRHNEPLQICRIHDDGANDADMRVGQRQDAQMVLYVSQCRLYGAT